MAPARMEASGRSSGLPAGGGGVIGFARFDPNGGAVEPLLLLPEGGAGFQPIDEEGGCGQGRLAVRGGGEDQDDRLAAHEATEAMDDGAAEEAPACLRFGGDGSE